MDDLETLLDGEDKTEIEVVESEPTGDKAPDEPEKVESESESEEKSEDKTDSSPEPSKETEANPELDGVHKELSRVRNLNRELKTKLESQQEKPKLTSPFEDEEKFTSEIDSRIDSQVMAAELRLSEKYARKAHGDELVDSAIDWFQEIAKDSPLLLKKFHDSGNDVDEVVDLYNKNLKAQKLEDLPAYEAEIEARIRKQVEEELKGKSDKDKELKDSIPASLVGEDSKGGLKGSDWEGPPDLESIIG